MILQQFRQFADLLAEPALLVDSDGMILEVNRAFRSTDLQRPDEVCGRRLHAIVETGDAQVDEYLRACARRHDVVIGALTFRQVDGQPVRLRCQGGAICARSDTQPARLLIRLLPRAVSDAAFEAINRQLAESERRRFENALRTSEQTLQTIFDQAGVGVALVDSRSGRFVRINQQFCDLVGSSPDEMTDTTWQKITHPDDLRAALDNMARLVAGEIREYSTEQRYVRKDGSIVWVNLTVSPTWLSGEQPVQHIAVVEDISDRKQAEEELRKAASRLDQALRGGNVGLWDWDVASNSVYYSPQLKIQLGYDPDEPWDTYHEWESRLHPEDKADAVQHVHDYLKGDLPEYISRFRLRRKDGAYAWILSQGEAEWDEQNKPRRLIGVHVDVTENMLHEQELERTNLELQQLTYAASHDLQEPLRSITSFSQLVERKYRELLDDDGRSWLDAIVCSTKRMKDLIGDLRGYTQLDAPIHSFEPTELERVLSGTLANLDAAIRDCNAEVTHDRLPVITGNASQLVQLFQNLVGNAIKYRSEQPPRVHISAERNGENWVFSVRDNGIGIEAEHQTVIFEVFRRLHHRHDQPGTGIGLAICRRVVHRHHGEIWVESTPGQGSTFRFTIPLKQDEVTQ